MPNTVDVLQQRFLKEIFTLILNGLNRAYKYLQNNARTFCSQGKNVFQKGTL